MKNASALWSLSKAVGKLQAVWAAIEDLDGELPPNLEAQLEQSQKEQGEAFSAVVCWLKDLENLIETHRKEERRLKDRREVLDARFERLKAWLSKALPEGERWSDGVHSLSWRKSTSLEVEAERIGLDFLRVYHEIDKAKIREHLAGGGTLDGAKMVTKMHLQIR